MAGNSIGKSLVLTTFGESHGKAVGGVLDGFPSNIEINTDFIQSELDRRRPGQADYSSPRNEQDRLEILSGLFEGRTTGAPIAFMVYNQDQRTQDYDYLKDLFRPSHADYTYQQKYGIRDYRGGGRSSARETLARVAAGAFAKIFLQLKGIGLHARIDQIGPYKIGDEGSVFSNKESQIPNPLSHIPPEVTEYLAQLKAEGDTTGGIIQCIITGIPAGIGEPVFDKLQADLAKAMLSINAVKGFEFGSGFEGAGMKGSVHNDRFIKTVDKITTLTNNSGGIQGGISNGQEIMFRVAFKPVSTLMQDQQTLTTTGESTTMKGLGRHDVCVVPRALPIVEAMAALTIADHILR